ncbi:MAG: hypothetical protein LBD23_04540 [Oscillospiraceae bacterium]|nr:hypothetical protein [Oscillospiraceae bacterium]
MADLFSSFNNTFNSLSAPRQSGGSLSNSVGNNSSVKPQKPTGFWGNVFKSETPKDTAGKEVVLPRNMQFHDTTEASAAQIFTDSSPQAHVKVTQGGGKTFFQKINIRSAFDVFFNS